MIRMRKTMQHLSYGLKQPSDLLEKLRWDADKLGDSPHAYDVFNFIVTAAVLAEWIQQAYSSNSDSDPFAAPTKTKKKGQNISQENWLIPSKAVLWIRDTSYLPNPHVDVCRHIENVLSICMHTANASKHFHWNDGRSITTIEKKPLIRNWYQWTFTSRFPDLYVEYKGEYYGLRQIKGILLQFYSGLIQYFEDQKPSTGVIS